MMDGAGTHDWMPLVASVCGGALFGAVAASVWCSRRSRRSTKIVGYGGNKVKVYHTPTFRSARVAWMIAELCAEDAYELVAYNPYLASDDDRQWYTACVHPHGTVPAMVQDDGRRSVVMLESAAICMYLAERHRQLLPQPDMMPTYLDWCVYAVSTVDRSLKTIDLELDKTEQDSKKLDEAFSAADAFARRLDKQLNKRDFICGSSLTAADVIVGYSVMWASVIKGGRIIYDYANVKSYLARLKSRPKFTETMGSTRDWINCTSEYKTPK